MSLSGTTGSLLVESAVTGAVFVAVDKLVNNQELDQKELMRGALSAGSAAGGSVLTKLILPKVVSNSDALFYWANPVTGGIVYAWGSNALKYDDRSFMQKMFMQAGAEVLATYISKPIEAMWTGNKYNQ